VPLEEAAPAAARPRKRALPKPSRKRRSAPGRVGPDSDPGGTDAPAGLVAKLRTWRLAEARRRGVPAFRIFPDRTLFALAEARPASEDTLTAVTGVGPRLARLYGPALLKLLAPGR